METQSTRLKEATMRRAMVIGAVLLAILAVTGIGVAAYNAGLDQGVAEGLRQSGQDAQAARVIGPRYGHGYGYGYGWGFFPFGLILFPLLVIGIILLVRGAFWRGRWGGPGGYGPGPYGPGGYGWGPPGPWGQGGPQRYEEWHRRQHDQPGERPADQPKDPTAEQQRGGGDPTGV
jgi:hypothetical protein